MYSGKRRLLVGALALAAVGTSGCRPRAPKAEQRKERISWGKTVNGLRVGLPVPDRTVAFSTLGTIHLENTGRTVLRLKDVQHWASWRFTVKTSAGKTVHYRMWGKLKPIIPAPLPPVVLQPGERKRVRLAYPGCTRTALMPVALLKANGPLMPPGKRPPAPPVCTVTATYDAARWKDKDLEGFWKGRVASRAAAFEFHNESTQVTGVAWGPEVGKVTLGVSGDRRFVKFGQNIDVSFHIRNRGLKVVRLRGAGLGDSWRLVFTAADDGMLWRAVWLGVPQRKGMDVVVRSGETIKRTFDVGGEEWTFEAIQPQRGKAPLRRKTLPPGRYKVSLACVHGTPGQKEAPPYWSGKLTAGTVEIKLLPDRKPK